MVLGYQHTDVDDVDSRQQVLFCHLSVVQSSYNFNLRITAEQSDLSHAVASCTDLWNEAFSNQIYDMAPSDNVCFSSVLHIC